jgi:aspartate 1-decarboxylase
MRAFLRSKIHKATVTEANLDYIGSITIDEALLEKADIAEYEQVLVVNNTNGNRLETYALKGPRNSGVICMNGAAAHLVQAGDEVIIMTFELSNQPSSSIVPINSSNTCPSKAISIHPTDQFIIQKSQRLPRLLRFLQISQQPIDHRRPASLAGHKFIDFVALKPEHSLEQLFILRRDRSRQHHRRRAAFNKLGGIWVGRSPGLRHRAAVPNAIHSLPIAQTIPHQPMGCFIIDLIPEDSPEGLMGQRQ